MASLRELRPLGLETFSLGCARRILDAHLEWWPFVQTVDQEEAGLLVRTLALVFPSQNPTVEEPLVLQIGLNRVIELVWCDMGAGLRWNVDWIADATWNSHSEAGSHQGIDRIIDSIERFMAEESAVFWTSDGDGGGAFGIVSALEIREGTFRRGELTTTIRSWRGSLDRSF